MIWSGLIIGAASFIVIGLFHPIVIKGEYYFSDRIWPLFLVGGILTCGASLFIQNVILSSVVAICGFSMLWSIIELKEQTQRVAKGWFPANPKRAAKASKGSKTSENPENRDNSEQAA